jgi:hypothetical protein
VTNDTLATNVTLKEQTKHKHVKKYWLKMVNLPQVSLGDKSYFS